MEASRPNNYADGIEGRGQIDCNILKIQTKQIEFITFNELAKQFSIKSIDMLQIDVEGAEYQIMSFINYDKIEIKQILFEAKHFDGTFKEGKKLEDIKKLLISKNYKLKKIDNENILATK